MCLNYEIKKAVPTGIYCNNFRWFMFPAFLSVFFVNMWRRYFLENKWAHHTATYSVDRQQMHAPLFILDFFSRIIKLLWSTAKKQNWEEGKLNKIDNLGIPCKPPKRKKIGELFWLMNFQCKFHWRTNEEAAQKWKEKK